MKAFKSKVEMYNYSMFEKLDILHDAKLDGMPDHMKHRIMEHISAFKSDFGRYFLNTTDKGLAFVRNIFRYPAVH